MELKNINEILIDLILSEDDDENIIMLNNMLINGLDPNISFSFDENGSRKPSWNIVVDLIKLDMLTY